MRSLVAPFKEFYRQADARSEKMAGNLLARKNVSQGAIVLVSGGFHTPAIARYLETEKISYVVVSPTMAKLDGASGGAYLSVFAREKTPVDNPSAGPKIFLNPARVASFGATPEPLPAGENIRNELDLTKQAETDWKKESAGKDRPETTPLDPTLAAFEILHKNRNHPDRVKALDAFVERLRQANYRPASIEMLTTLTERLLRAFPEFVSETQSALLDVLVLIAVENTANPIIVKTIWDRIEFWLSRSRHPDSAVYMQALFTIVQRLDDPQGAKYVDALGQLAANLLIRDALDNKTAAVAFRLLVRITPAVPDSGIRHRDAIAVLRNLSISPGNAVEGLVTAGEVLAQTEDPTLQADLLRTAIRQLSAWRADFAAQPWMLVQTVKFLTTGLEQAGETLGLFDLNGVADFVVAVADRPQLKDIVAPLANYLVQRKAMAADEAEWIRQFDFHDNAPAAALPTVRVDSTEARVLGRVEGMSSVRRLVTSPVWRVEFKSGNSYTPFLPEDYQQDHKNTVRSSLENGRELLAVRAQLVSQNGDERHDILFPLGEPMADDETASENNIEPLPLPNADFSIYWEWVVRKVGKFSFRFPLQFSPLSAHRLCADGSAGRRGPRFPFAVSESKLYFVRGDILYEQPLDFSEKKSNMNAVRQALKSRTQ